MKRSLPDGPPTPTLRDVAARAGVSIRTVSNVVTSAVAVRPETRSRVEAVIDELGYRPNLAARRLRSRRAQVIGLVLPDVTVPYFREFTDEVLTAASARGFAVVVEQTHGDPVREREVLRNAKLRHVDGVILAALTLRPGDLDTHPGRPVVLAGTEAFDETIDAVSADYAAAGRSIGTLLGEQGRRRPVIVTARQPCWPITESARYRGFVDGLAEHGVMFDGSRIVEVPAVTLADGRDAAATLVARFPDADAVFANADALAVGVLAGLHDADRCVPNDVALVGFGDIEYAAYTQPSLTSVNTMRAAAAGAAVALLQERLAGTERNEPRRIDTGFLLMERATTAPTGTSATPVGSTTTAATGVAS